MPVEPLLPRRVSNAVTPGRVDRVEYLDFQDLDEHREYRFRVYGPEGSSELRMRIAKEAFDARRVRRQDGADVCYQKLLRTIAAVETPYPDVITIDDVDLSSYRDDHTAVPRRRSSTPSSPTTPVTGPRKQPQYRPRTPTVASPLPVAVPVTNDIGPALEEGQRVNHAVFGIGVTTATTRARTVVRFDRDGLKTFVTSMLEVEVLSAPHTWETTPRGVNRLCKTPSAP